MFCFLLDLFLFCFVYIVGHRIANTYHLQQTCEQQDYNEKFWCPCALLPLGLFLKALEEKITFTFQRYVNLDAQEQ